MKNKFLAVAFLATFFSGFLVSCEEKKEDPTVETEVNAQPSDTVEVDADTTEVDTFN